MCVALAWELRGLEPWERHAPCKQSSHQVDEYFPAVQHGAGAEPGQDSKERQGVYSQVIREECESGERQVEVMVTQTKVLQRGQRRKRQWEDGVYGEWKQGRACATGQALHKCLLK